jgi:hypothetical protein
MKQDPHEPAPIEAVIKGISIVAGILVTFVLTGFLIAFESCLDLFLPILTELVVGLMVLAILALLQSPLLRRLKQRYLSK